MCSFFFYMRFYATEKKYGATRSQKTNVQTIILSAYACTFEKCILFGFKDINVALTTLPGVPRCKKASISFFFLLSYLRLGSEVDKSGSSEVYRRGQSDNSSSPGNVSSSGTWGNGDVFIVHFGVKPPIFTVLLSKTAFTLII